MTFFFVLFLNCLQKISTIIENAIFYIFKYFIVHLLLLQQNLLIHLLSVRETKKKLICPFKYDFAMIHKKKKKIFEVKQFDYSMCINNIPSINIYNNTENI